MSHHPTGVTTARGDLDERHVGIDAHRYTATSLKYSVAQLARDIESPAIGDLFDRYSTRVKRTSAEMGEGVAVDHLTGMTLMHGERTESQLTNFIPAPAIRFSVLIERARVVVACYNGEKLEFDGILADDTGSGFLTARNESQQGEESNGTPGEAEAHCGCNHQSSNWTGSPDITS
jgi:hypothetical protein